MIQHPMYTPAPCDRLCKAGDWDLPAMLNAAHQICDGGAAMDRGRLALIEECLLTHPGVATCGVVGEPDALRTKSVPACVALDQGVDASVMELKAWVKYRLVSHSYTREIEFLEALPMMVAGKELKRRACQEGQA